MVPSSIVLNGQTFYIAANYYGAPYGTWTLNATGPLSINGRTLTGAATQNNPWGLTSGSPFEFALYSAPK